MRSAALATHPLTLVLALAAALLPPACQSAPPAPVESDAIVVGGAPVALGMPVLLRVQHEEPRSDAMRSIDRVVLLHTGAQPDAPDSPQWRRRAPSTTHFTIDVDGSVHQHLDVRAAASADGAGEGRAVTIALVGPGLFRPKDAWRLDAWCERDEQGLVLAASSRPVDAQARPASAPLRPRRGRVRGTINGYAIETIDYTEAQYQSLVKLTAALMRALPAIHSDAPRDSRGFVPQHALSREALERFRGLAGHCHVDPHGTAPGPAFDWEGYVCAVRVELGLLQRRFDGTPAR